MSNSAVLRLLPPSLRTAETVRCLKLLLYWPLFGLLFFAAERLYTPPRTT